jgi:hypothetical protein
MDNHRWVSNPAAIDNSWQKKRSFYVARLVMSHLSVSLAPPPWLLLSIVPIERMTKYSLLIHKHIVGRLGLSDCNRYTINIRIYDTVARITERVYSKHLKSQSTKVYLHNDVKQITVPNVMSLVFVLICKRDRIDKLGYKRRAFILVDGKKTMLQQVW